MAGVNTLVCYVTLLVIHAWINEVNGGDCNTVFQNTPTFKNCTYRCHCKNDTQCDQKTGDCLNGCEFGWMGPGCQYRNIARNRTVVRNVGGTTNVSEQALQAVDGDVKTCARTKNENAPGGYNYWRIQWNITFRIVGLVLKIRQEDVGDFNSFRVETGSGPDNRNFNSTCYTRDDITGTTEMEIMCTQPVWTKHLRIIHAKPNVRMRVCEVEIYGGRVVTFNKFTNQTTTKSNRSSWLSVDGQAHVKDVVSANDTCSSTQIQSNPHWLVDFETLYVIQSIYFYGGLPPLHPQYRYFKIFLLMENSFGTEIYNDTGLTAAEYQPKVVEVTNQITSRYLKIYRPVTDVLAICEVIAFAECPIHKCGWDCTTDCFCASETTGKYQMNEVCPYGCSGRWTGRNQTCNIECNTTAWGDHCQNACRNCNCNVVTGQCEHGCNGPWYPPDCERECNDTAYGQNCSQTCGQCKDITRCDMLTGNCTNGCISGWKPPLCQYECATGTFGDNCINTCGHCHGDTTCNTSTGICEDGCSSGYNTPFCNTTCVSGYHGMNCEEECGHCKNNTTCNATTGYCHQGCEPGWKANTCKDDCNTAFQTTPTFKNCTYRCHCKNDTQCDQTTGDCNNGCEVGWMGPGCQYRNIARNYSEARNVGSTNNGSESGRKAVDGDENSCARSNTTPVNEYHYWRIKFKIQYRIVGLVVKIHQDEVGNFKNLRVETGSGPKNAEFTNVCYKHDGTNVTTEMEIMCTQPVWTQHLRIIHNEKNVKMRLCEVEIFGGRVVTFNKPTNQSSTYFNQSSDLSVDGQAHLPGTAANDVCSNTTNETNPFWLVDFQSLFVVQSVYFYGGLPPLYRDYREFKVFLLNDSSAETNIYNDNGKGGALEYQPKVIKQTKQTAARYMKISREVNTDVLAICEVIAFAECPIHKCGWDCSIDCNCAAETTGKYQKDGTCPNGCSGRWTGIDQKCNLECNTTTWGNQCQHTCGECDGKESCNTATGYCENGCNGALYPPDCKNECNDTDYGKNCSQKCGHCENKERCNMTTGECSNGCISGWAPPLCQEACAFGTFGDSCNQTCGHCHGNATCYASTGICEDGCSPGYNVPFCNTTCVSGFYGVNCTEECGHCKNDTMCNATTGFCHDGCEPGWKANTCKEVCSAGTYGESCTQQCGHCNGSSKCNASTGVCEDGCSPGYLTSVCNTTCEIGSYGMNCIEKCGNCKDGSTCNATSGECHQGCEPGWMDDICKIACENGTYGENCSRECGNCTGEMPCSHTTGLCAEGCAAGFNGERCDQECSAGKYGVNCSQSCGLCNTPEECNKETGLCTDKCLPGWNGSYCNLTCPDGYYGLQCNHPCGHCRSDEICNFSTGACISCQDGYKGDTCNQTCNNGTYGENCSGVCGNCTEEDTCNNVTGICPNGCVAGYKGERCNATCEIGSYGMNCIEKCGHCKNGSTCNATSGECHQGCEPGWMDAICKIACENGTYGENCSRECGNCTGEMPCSHTTGLCAKGCAAGFNGERCDQECSAGQFGVNCSQSCGFCNTPEECNKETGLCTDKCLPGWNGSYCDLTCPDGYYGLQCNHSCGPCRSDEICNFSSGACISCEDGYKGDTCNQTCNTGTYGENCSGVCGNCTEEDTCNNVTGICPNGCAAGYKEERCNATCLTGTFGNNCSRTCGYCSSSNECSKETGSCSGNCLPGWIGSHCNESCEIGTYGDKCDGACGNCLGGEENCNKVTGICTSGCVAGYNGELCKETCSSGNFGINCNQTCGYCNSSTECDKEEGYCSGSCMPGWNNSFCNESCAEGYFGFECMQLCSDCGDGKYCDHVNGDCISCDSGSKGEACEQSGRKDHPPESSQTGTIIGVIVTMLIACGVSVAAVFFIRRRRNMNTKFSGSDRDQQIALHDAIVIPDEKIEQSEDDVYKNAAIVNSYIKVSDLRTVCVSAKRNPQPLFSDFETIPYGLNKDASEAMDSNYKSKNRYREIFPYNINRVHLPMIPGDQLSTYINASYINGYDIPKKYIAAQGALETTIADVWRMVWAKNISTIAMLTNCVEQGKLKCVKYWPEEETEVHGDISVALEKSELFSDFVTRTFLCTKVGSDKKRTVVQFHYTAWPDKDVPDSALSLVQFWRAVRYSQSSQAIPWLVHCSAGVGRTGTFIALDSLYDMGTNLGTINVLDTVNTLRRQRLNMVQTEEQYVYVHETAAEVLCPIGSICKNDDFDELYQSLILSNGKATKKLKNEFEEVNVYNVEPDDEQDGIYCNVTLSQSADAKLKDNIGKSRDPNIMPTDLHRPKLSMVVIGRNNFINAVYVPTFRDRSKVILTQIPLEDTVVDFLRLIWEYNVSIVVLLEESMAEECSYYPMTTTSKKIDVFTTELRNENIEECYVQRTIVVSLKGRKEQREFRIFQLRSWPKDKSTPIDTGSMLRLISAIDSDDGSRGVAPIIVQCLDGARKSGVFSTLWCILERQKSDSEIAVAETVRMSRVRRRQIIDNFEQYKYCYNVIRDYLDSFSVYANAV